MILHNAKNGFLSAIYNEKYYRLLSGSALHRRVRSGMTTSIMR